MATALGGGLPGPPPHPAPTRSALATLMCHWLTHRQDQSAPAGRELRAVVEVPPAAGPDPALFTCGTAPGLGLLHVLLPPIEDSSCAVHPAGVLAMVGPEGFPSDAVGAALALSSVIKFADQLLTEGQVGHLVAGQPRHTVALATCDVAEGVPPADPVVFAALEDLLVRCAAASGQAGPGPP